MIAAHMLRDCTDAGAHHTLGSEGGKGGQSEISERVGKLVPVTVDDDT